MSEIDGEHALSIDLGVTKKFYQGYKFTNTKSANNEDFNCFSET